MSGKRKDLSITPVEEPPPRSHSHQGEFKRLVEGTERIRSDGEQGIIFLEEGPGGIIKVVDTYKCFLEGGGPEDCYFQKSPQAQSKPQTTLGKSICIVVCRMSVRKPCALWKK